MLDWQWNIDDAKAAWQDEAREEGINYEREKIAAFNLIHMGLPVQNICDATDLSPQLVQKLASLSSSDRLGYFALEKKEERWYPNKIDY